MRHRAPDPDPAPAMPMPEFPLLEIRMTEDPRDTYRRWNELLREFKDAWDKWCLTQQGS